MNIRSDLPILCALLLLALFIWLRDLAWISTAPDTLPILIALPLFAWIGSPWSWRHDPQPLALRPLLIAALLFFFGAALNSTLTMTIGWTLLFWTWLKARLEPASLPSVRKLLVLPLLAFPWIVLDADRIGWWFRLSGAWVAAHFFSLLGYDVILQGTQLLVDNLPISVEAACAGLNTLQSMLIAGSVVAFLILGDTPLYWWNLPVLVAAAWLANTLRVIMIAWAALEFGRAFAMGPFHEWGGWAIILVMFSLCWLFFALQKNAAIPAKKNAQK